MWRRPVIDNGYNLFYQPHENAQGSHRIGHISGTFRVLPDGHSSAKKRYEAIRLALTANYEAINYLHLRLEADGWKVTPVRKASHQDVILYLLQRGPVCGVEIQNTKQMNRYAARMYELRRWFDIGSERCRRHRHEGNDVQYVLQ